MTRKLKEFAKPTTPHGLASAEFLPDHVCVLLSLYNGADLLPDQLSALAAQSHKRWSLIISDDGSTDHWQDIVARFAESVPGQCWLMGGSNKGHGRNYLSLALAAGPSVPYIAFCNQRDVWFEDKLARAIEHLKAVPKGRPGLYCSRQVLCDRDLSGQQPSESVRRKLTFQNAMVHTPFGFGTMVLNRYALDLVQDTVRHVRNQAAHDGWIYQLIVGAGGLIIFDEEPSQFHRKPRLCKTAAWPNRKVPITAARIEALNHVRHWLTPAARDTLSHLASGRDGNKLGQLRALWRSGVHAQTRAGTLSLWAATILKRR